MRAGVEDRQPAYRRAQRPGDLGVVGATDLGPARKISKIRLLRPVIAAAVIIPFFVDWSATDGMALVVEIAGVAAGLLCGLAASALMGVYRSPTTGKPVSRAGLPYAIFWAPSSAPARPSPTAPCTGSPPRW